jgi:tRNA uridine 5-carboxymethylaminomethyl modification enzyme
MAATCKVVINGEQTSVAQALTRPPVTLGDLEHQGVSFEADSDRPDLDRSTIVAEFKYGGYLKRHEAQLERSRADEARRIPPDFAYVGVPGLSREVVERLSAVRPSTIGQAARVPGVTPAAVAVVAARIVRGTRAKGVSTPS